MKFYLAGTSKQLLDNHNKEQHKIGKKYACLVSSCFKDFVTIAKRDNHMTNYHCVQCDQCVLKISPLDFTNHMNNHNTQALEQRQSVSS